MAKWADYCLSEVFFDKDYTKIQSAVVLEDLGEKFGKSFKLTRKELLEKIHKGERIITMTLGKYGWDKGHILKVVKVSGKEYIKVKENNLCKDQLSLTSSVFV